MSKIIPGNTSIAEAKRQLTQPEKDAKRMERKNAGFDHGGSSFITLNQHEKLVSAVIAEYDEHKNREILEYVEYRLSVTGRLVAYRRLWEYRIARALRPIAPLIKQYRAIQQRKRLRALAAKNNGVVDPRTLTPDQVVQAIENAK
jgi:hypothetical protein